jgi:hypothetical protein
MSKEEDSDSDCHYSHSFVPIPLSLTRRWKEMTREWGQGNIDQQDATCIDFACLFRASVVIPPLE